MSGLIHASICPYQIYPVVGYYEKFEAYHVRRYAYASESGIGRRF